MSSKIKFEKDTDNVPAIHADVDHGVVGTEKEDNVNLGVVQQGSDVAEEMKLDDARRVKVVSPGLLVVKRFFRNKLALVGLGILVVLFAFCFLGAAVYPYNQSQTFTTWQDLEVDYAYARISTDYIRYNAVADDALPTSTVLYSINSYIKDINSKGLNAKDGIKDETTGKNYRLVKNNENLFTLELNDSISIVELVKSRAVGTFSASKAAGLTLTLSEPDAALTTAIQNSWEENGKKTSAVDVTYKGNKYTLKDGEIVCTYPALVENTEARGEGVDDAFVTEVTANLDGSFIYDGVEYTVSPYAEKNNTGYRTLVFANEVVVYACNLNFDRYDITKDLSAEYKLTFLAALSEFDPLDPATHTFVYDTVIYDIVKDGDTYEVSFQEGGEKVPQLYLSNYSIRRYTGEDTVSVATKKAFRAVMDEVKAEGALTKEVVVKMETLDEKGDYVYDDEGVLQFSDEEFFVKSEDKGSGQQFVFRNVQSKLVADIYASPTKDHILGLDANAMDVLARIMYGGRISLMIGFIVVFIQIIIGSILGGISGYFGGAVDNVIMRIVDIFYCIPTLPILIILGSMFDAINLDNTLRVVYMMMILGFLGWPGIARLVRGQILSLREQDFMIAAEASGLTAKRKILKHLIPNVIPQLIVQATMGLGSVILTESTLSFLGLGVKYPMATWGQIINSVSSVNAMKMYTYIWIPVGMLICLAVIAFNFVGDGLRDAFDPKMNK